MPQSVTVDGETYLRVARVRADSGGVAVYQAPSRYLRLGEPAVIERYRRVHQQMESIGLPVARVRASGIHGEWGYYTEDSLGEKTFAKLFGIDFARDAHVSDECFNTFLDAARAFLHAQLHGPRQDQDFDSFAAMTHLETLSDELPDEAEAIQARYLRSREHLRDVPFVLSHGDFNPANMFPAGCIDIENAMNAPLGYDAVTALETPDWFIFNDEAKAFSHYAFSEDQKRAYRAMCSTLYRGAVDIEAVWSDLAFFRAVWMTARMHNWPDTQRYRYQKFIQTYL